MPEEKPAEPHQVEAFVEWLACKTLPDKPDRRIVRVWAWTGTLMFHFMNGRATVGQMAEEEEVITERFQTLCNALDKLALSAEGPLEALPDPIFRHLETSLGDSLSGFPRFWHLFGYCLARETRINIFEPSYNDLLAEYLRSRAACYGTRGAQLWLKVAFTLRTMWLLIDCSRVAWWMAGVTLIAGLICEVSRLLRFLQEFFR